MGLPTLSDLLLVGVSRWPMMAMTTSTIITVDTHFLFSRIAIAYSMHTGIHGALNFATG